MLFIIDKDIIRCKYFGIEDVFIKGMDIVGFMCMLFM